MRARKVILIFALTGSLGFVAGAYSGILGDQLGENLVAICQSLIDVDAAVLGFLGVAAVFALEGHRASIYTSEAELRDLDAQHSRRIAFLSRTGYSNLKNSRSGRTEEEEENSFYSENRNKLEQRIIDLRSNAKFVCLLAVLAASFLVASILGCLLAMSKTVFVAQFFAFSILMLVIGLTAMFLMIMYSTESLF